MPDTTTDPREIWHLTGEDALAYLQGLVSNDVLPLGEGPGMVWTALLTPQGKYLADFFVIRRDGDGADALLLDLPQGLAAATIKRLQMYRLRSAVQLAPADLHLSRGQGPAPAGAMPDPRHPDLGWRFYGPQQAGDATDWTALQVALMVPSYPADLVPDDSYILEMGFERLHGVDFRKGCYVGQEVTARMKHKTELRKGLVRLRMNGAALPGTPITLPDGREVGRLGSVAGNCALAHLRYDRIDAGLIVGAAQLFPEA
ncbi:MAG: folate-binding protein [Paracoccaceae bacterium]